MLPVQLRRNEEELAVIASIARSGDDGPVLMLNLNRYKADAGFPGKGIHGDYITGLEKFPPAVGGQILWRQPVHGQAVGDQRIDEFLAVWYPSHQSFLDGFVKLTDYGLFSAFLHEAKPLKFRIAAISDLPKFRSESG